MEYRISLGGTRLYGVTSVTELARRGINEYFAVGGGAFCTLQPHALRTWEIALETDSANCATREDDAALIRRLERLRKDDGAVVFELLSATQELSVRVVVSAVRSEALLGGGCRAVISLTEYVRPKTKYSARAGSAPYSGYTTAGMAYQVLKRSFDAGTPVEVINPSTGAQVTNIADKAAKTVLAVRACEKKPAALSLWEKKREVMGDAYGGYDMAGSSE